MVIFKKNRTLRRFKEPVYSDGYSSIPYYDIKLPMDVQTLDNVTTTSPDGSDSTHKLKVFCDKEILVEDQKTSQKSDRLWFQGKWFECKSSALADNTPLRHWVATFVECADQDAAPEGE